MRYLAGLGPVPGVVWGSGVLRTPWAAWDMGFMCVGHDHSKCGYGECGG